MTTRRSALPVRMSYKVKVRSEPILASTDDSARLNLMAEMVSVEVGNVRLDIGALLGEIKLLVMGTVITGDALGFIPYLDDRGGGRKQGVRPMVVYRAVHGHQSIFPVGEYGQLT